MNCLETMTAQKLDRIWSDRLERMVAVRIHYCWEESGNGKLFTLNQVDELD